jgi:hypothetical protein
MFDFYRKNIIYNYVKLATVLLAPPDVLVFSCAAVNPAVRDVLTAVEAPIVASVPIAAPILLMTSNLLFLFL